MKLLFIRHGDPDYSIDSLTEKGRKEAEYLSERLSSMKIDAFFTSPLGRAKDTASPTLKKMNRTAEEFEWLREFHAPVFRPDLPDQLDVPWDFLPQDLAADERFYQYEHWHETPVMQEGNVKEAYLWVTSNFDLLLKRFGYIREPHYYRALQSNNDTLAFFCHFGVQAVILSHLLGISPMIVLHGFCAAPTSVTTVVTEERRKGIASFRILSFGDISHLYAKDEPPAFAARFRESYENEWERKD